MPDPTLCTDAEIRTLVHAFYAKVRQDALLGPVFNARIHDWDKHLVLLTHFWSSILRGSGTYSGTPMQKHAALPELAPELFRRWLDLFLETTHAQPNRAMGRQAHAAACRIAQSLWYGWQMHNHPQQISTHLKLD